MARFMLIPTTEPRIYSLSLLSPPQTPRSPEMEAGLLKVVADKLKCKVNRINRYENSDGSKEVYDKEIARLEGLFKEAEVCMKEIEKTNPDRHLCPYAVHRARPGTADTKR